MKLAELSVNIYVTVSFCRYKEGGEALLVLLPSEEKGMIAQLQEKKVPINKIQWVNVSYVTVKDCDVKNKKCDRPRGISLISGLIAEFVDDLSAFCRVNCMNVLCEEWAKSCSCWECMLSSHKEPVIMWLLWSMISTVNMPLKSQSLTGWLYDS